MLIRYCFLYLRGRLCKLLHRSYCYETKYGVKMMNRRSGKSAAAEAETAEMPLAALTLGVDGLRDAYTHCGKSIADSPHAELIGHALKDEGLGSSEYVRLERIGALDGRDSFWRPVSYHEKITRARIEEARADNSDAKPITLYTAQGKYYIADGKHRAALYALLGRETIPCRVRQLGAASLDYMRRIAEVMRRKPEEYKTNLALIDAILEESKEKQS